MLEIDVGDLVEYAYEKRASDGSCYPAGGEKVWW